MVSINDRIEVIGEEACTIWASNYTNFSRLAEVGGAAAVGVSSKYLHPILQHIIRCWSSRERDCQYLSYPQVDYVDLINGVITDKWCC